MAISWEGALLDWVFEDFEGKEDQGFQRKSSGAEVRSLASSTWIWMMDSSGSMSLAGAESYGRCIKEVWRF